MMTSLGIFLVEITMQNRYFFVILRAPAFIWVMDAATKPALRAVAACSMTNWGKPPFSSSRALVAGSIAFSNKTATNRSRLWIQSPLGFDTPTLVSIR